MYRQSTDRGSPTSSSHKTNTNFSILQSRQHEQVSTYHFSQYLSIDKSPKKGIATSVSFTTQNPIAQNNQQQFPFNIKNQQSVYEQYLKSLESQIASRERQRVELQKGLDELQHEYKIVWDQLAEEKRKAAEFRSKVDMLENMIRESEEKKRVLVNEKQVILKQYQYETQKKKILQANEMKLRISYETLQKTNDSLQQQHQKMKLQFQLKTNSQTQTIQKLHQKIANFKFTSSQLEQKFRSLEIVSKNYKDQADQELAQKNRIIQSLTREKGFVEKQYHKEQKEHLEVKVIATQRQEMIKQLNKRVTQLEQLHQLEKDKLNYRISQLTFENSSLLKQNQSVKSQMTKQLQITANQNIQLKLALGQFEKQKKVDLVHNEQLHKSLDRLQKEINALVESKLTAEREKQMMKLTHQKEVIGLKDKYEKLERSYNEKCAIYEQASRQLVTVQKEFESYKIQTNSHIEVLTNEVNSLKVQITQVASQSSQQVSKLIRQKESLLEEINKRSLKHQKQTKELSAQLSKQSQTQQNELKKYYQNQISHFTQSINSLNDQITQLTHQLLSNNQTHINEINRLTVKYQQKLSHITQLQQGSSHQLQLHYNQQLCHQEKTIKTMSQTVTNHQATIQSLKVQLTQIYKEYHDLEAQSNHQINRLNQQLAQKNSFILKLEEQNHRQRQTYSQDKTKLLNQNSKLKNQFNQINVSLDQIIQSIPDQKQSKVFQTTEINQSFPLNSVKILFLIKSFLISVLHQNISLQQQLSSSQQINSQLQTQKNHTSQVLQNKVGQLTHNLKHQITHSQELQSAINKMVSHISSVVQFAQKYSGDSIKKVQKNTSSLLTFDSHDSHRNHSCTDNQFNDALEITKGYCESLSTFIGERLYVISIFMQENAQLKQQLNTKTIQTQNLSQKLNQQIQKYQQLHKQNSATITQVQFLKQKLQSSNKQNTQSINSLKQHIASYKGQLNNYEKQIQMIFAKFEEHQRKDIISLKQISLMEEEIHHYKEELQIKQKQFQNQCKEILKLNSQLQDRNERFLEKEKQLTQTKREIQKISHKHILQVQSLKMTHFAQLQLLQQSSLTQKKSLKHQTQSTISNFQKQSLSLQQKIRRLQKLLQTKTLQYTQMQSHFTTSLKTLQSTHQAQLKSLQNQIKYLQNKSHSPSKEIMRNKIGNLENHVQQLEKQLKILSDNNTILRKNYISALQQKEALREEVKLNKSQRSDSMTKSKDPVRNTSQQIKNKYLLKKSSQRRNSNKTQQSLSQSMGPRSYSNSNIHSSQNKRFQSPRDSSTKMSSHNMTHGNNNFEPHAQTQRPLSNIQRSAPHIPLDLKRIRQRNQKYFGSKDGEVKKQAPSYVQCKKSEMKAELLNVDELPLLDSPVKFLEEPPDRFY